MSAGRNNGYFETVGRLRLHYRSWEVDSPRGVLLVIHGIGEHSGRYDGFAAALGGYGFSTFALDLRGHGHSEGRRGHTPSFDAFLQDVDRFRREVAAIGQVAPMILVGHSMGGLIALRYIQEYETPVRGVVLSSPWLGTAMVAPRWKINLALPLSSILPALPLSTGLEPQYLSHDPEVVRRYRHDPLVHDKITPRLFTRAADAMGIAFQRMERVRVPLLFQLAGDDRIVDTARSLAFARALRSGSTVIRVYPGHYHEIYNEADRGLILQDLREWLTRRVEEAA